MKRVKSNRGIFGCLSSDLKHRKFYAKFFFVPMTDQYKKLTDKIELRPVSIPADEDFLKELYFTTRDDVQYLPEEMRGPFLEMQYLAQKTHYNEYFDPSRSYVVFFDGKPVGRYWIEPRKEEIRLIDIAILPEYRGAGIGSVLMKDTMREAAEGGIPYTLHAVQESKAIKLYEKLGFQKTGENGLHDKMEWRAPDEDLEIQK